MVRRALPRRQRRETPPKRPGAGTAIVNITYYWRIVAAADTPQAHGTRLPLFLPGAAERVTLADGGQ
jgi:hypothetical protein